MFIEANKVSIFGVKIQNLMIFKHYDTNFKTAYLVVL